ncbi:uncharacterized protein B0T15DRAFT_507877 [Chaetomium strumarium]|uniref:Uncharacterized protein n=1 Tax=Chaetomium strumarium TaxID=1170767 RepID=A0AAJ0H4D4_9PEZI|nr:hypothetical protein B0T15DRAFT_507877 [Chaetomium strumarium]
MGTRHLICVFWKGRWVIAQYGQFDGYPEVQGVRLFKFLSVAHNIERLRAGLDHVYYPTAEELEAIRDECAAFEQNLRDQGLDWGFRTNVVKELYPTLDRETSARILSIIARPTQAAEEDGAEDVAEEPKKFPVQLRLGFANDSLFCEWAYVVDLDQEVLEVYGGHEHKHDGHRFKDVGEPDQPVPTFVCSFTFSELYLTKSPQEFVQRISKALRGEADNAASDEETKVQEKADDAASNEETGAQEEGRGA